MTVRFLVLAGVLGLSSLAAAKQSAAAPPLPSQPKAQRFDFDDDEVEADRALPQLEVVDARKGSTHDSLIRYRTTFVPELMKSANDL